ncbi:MAG: 7-carboxy-7-deazaguanine synthase [Alphaproteobacteria bacterium]
MGATRYAVKEIFLTLQGEGVQVGRVAVFCRFAGCNLWSGREADRPRADCRFCDTDFVGTDGTGGGSYAGPEALADAIAAAWPSDAGERLCVLTGGEPLLQVDRELIDALHVRSFRIAVETNGTVDAPDGLDWICVSPKAGTTLRVRAGDELKLVFPQPGVSPRDFEKLDFRHFSLQPMDGPDVAANTAAAIAYCLDRPRWRLSIQAHKRLGLR